MNIWVITAVLHADDGTLLGATMAEIKQEGHAIVTPAALLPIEEVVAKAKAGPVAAIWPQDGSTMSQPVQVVQLPGGGETVETVSKGLPHERTLAELWTLDELVAAARAQSDVKH